MPDAPARRAPLIFSGTVLAVERVPPATQNGIGTVRVTFRVDEGIRGVRTGQQLTISEWDFLWIAGERYRVGEALTVYLHAPSTALGLTSAVAADSASRDRAGIKPGGRVLPMNRMRSKTRRVPLEN